MNDNGGMLNLPSRAGVRLDGAQWSNLHTFAVAARHLSFARAADELCLSASAVSAVTIPALGLTEAGVVAVTVHHHH